MFIRIGTDKIYPIDRYNDLGSQFLITFSSGVSYEDVKENFVPDNLAELEVLDNDGENVLICKENFAKRQYIMTKVDESTGEEVIDIVLEEISATDLKVNKLQKTINLMNQTPDPETMTLEELQYYRQQENKKAFETFLFQNPVQYEDGKLYGVTMDDLTEIQLNFTQYEIAVAAGVENARLEWHAVHEKCVPWEKENLVKLTLLISDFTLPYFRKMQDIKEKIYATSTKDEVMNIEIAYSLSDAEVSENEE